MSQANKHVLMAALTYNLKKYLKFNGKTTVAKVQSLQTQLCGLIKQLFTSPIQANISLSNF